MVGFISDWKYKDLDIFNNLAIDPHTVDIPSVDFMAKRLKLVSTKIHPDRLYGQPAPENTDLPAMNGLMDRLKNAKDSKKLLYLVSINSRGKEGWKSTWGIKDSIGVWSLLPPPTSSPFERQRRPYSSTSSGKDSFFASAGSTPGQREESPSARPGRRRENKTPNTAMPDSGEEADAHETISISDDNDDDPIETSRCQHERFDDGIVPESHGDEQLVEM